MDKPLVVAINDFREEIAKLINNSGIPIGIITDILKLLIPALENVAQEEYKVALQEYQKNIKDNKENTVANN